MGFRTERAYFVIVHGPADAMVAQDVRRALESAAARITAWGGFSETVEVRVFPDHRSLEAAVRRHGYDWLRAWARYDDVLLQSPRTFSLFEGGDDNLAELLTHELTHCLMYQRAADRETWRATDRNIPIWFREGMASYTARQGRRRMSEAGLADWMARTGRDPVAEARALYRDESEAVYAAAHWAFTFLVERYGAAVVGRTLDELGRGHDFDAAFEAAVGLSRDDFERDFDRYVRWEGWAGRRHLPPGEVLESARPGSGPPADRPVPWLTSRRSRW